ncbi:MAG: tRNA-dihydrouridine synthase [Candidatus Paceibacterota bacterium]|jgi:nifR3 family TIM-barrel protein
MKSFWQGLPKPFFVMAPMADVTDVAFRALVAKHGKPDVFWTEFVSADGLFHLIERGEIESRAGMIYHTSNPLLRDLQFTEEQRPIAAQIFSGKPEMITYATKLVAELGFDGVDLNMGCPDKSIEKQGAGAALVKNPALAKELIRAAKEASPLPVSVKTRIGYNKESLDEWLTALLEANPVAITLHLRTRKEMSFVPADWELMKKAVALRDRVNPKVLLIGNGDVQDMEDARTKVAESGCDGAMFGRAMFGNPWVFAGRKTEDTPLAEKLAALLELAYDFEKITPAKSFAILKKHIKAFVTGFAGAAELRTKLMTAESATELEKMTLDAVGPLV